MLRMRQFFDAYEDPVRKFAYEHATEAEKRVIRYETDVYSVYTKGSYQKASKPNYGALARDVAGDNRGTALKGVGKADNIPGRGYHKEVYANKPVKVTEAVDKWDEFLGPGEYTDIHPRTGLKDPDRIFSADGKRSIRFGSHEMNSKPSKFHYHEEIWTYDPINNVMNVDNTVVRVPYKN